MLNWNEKDIYIILLMYADSDQKCFPSINTLCRVSGKSNKTVIKALKGLEDKHLLKKEARITKNGQSSNLYTLYDFESVWEAENIEQIPEIVSTETKRKQLYELAQELNYVVKENGLETVPVKAQNQAPKSNKSNQFDNTTNYWKSQDMERYTFDQIHQFFDYDIMLQEYPEQQQDIDTVMNVLYDTLNTSKPTLRIAGQDKPVMTVIAKLMKLDKEAIMFAIKKYSEQTERIKNPTAYLLTILYNAPEQRHLDMKNQEGIDKERSEHSQTVKKAINRNKDSNNNFMDFPQRTYDYDKLEKMLLKR